MKSITERVHQRFIFLVNQGCGEWGITTHESLGQILYKYTNTVDDIHLDIFENGFAYKFGTQDFLMFFHEITDLEDMPTLRDIMIISRDKRFDDLICFYIIKKNGKYLMKLPFRIGNEFTTFICRLIP
ncbi:MAG: hypothetical protein Q7S87_08420 [Agitococcus sp.]|nr:hypothetical protein [Agitococcus sp.]